MPNRLLREGILDSDPVNSLSWPEEVFYRRLMSVVDDFGRFDARTAVLKSRLYPLKSDVREADITRWIAACEKAGLVALYSADGKPYLLFHKFKQHVRAETSKYPTPPPGLDAVQVQCNGTSPASHPRSESDAESETKAHAETGPQRARFEEFFKVYPKKSGRDEAEAVFRRLDPQGPLFERILAAVIERSKAEDWKAEHGRFVPKAAVWLEERRWEEVRTSVPRPKAIPSRAVVADLLRKGKTVRPEILALYPDLAEMR